MALDSAIETDELSRHFGDLRAVDNLSIRARSGTVFGFLGPNGSGKTTTIRLLLGLIPATSGSATVLGYDCATEGDEIRERTGALLEHPGLYERMTAEENLEFFGRIWHLSSVERQSRGRALLEHFGLWDRRGDRVGSWSRGMRQKLAIARTLLHSPELVFLDEPTAGLDPVASASLRNDLALLAREEGVTVFLTTHNLAEAERLCDEVAVIRDGRLLDAGPTDQLMRSMSGRHVTARFHSLPEDAGRIFESISGIRSYAVDQDAVEFDLETATEPAEVLAALVRNDLRVDEFAIQRGTLEEAFLSLVDDSSDVD